MNLSGYSGKQKVLAIWNIADTPHGLLRLHRPADRRRRQPHPDSDTHPPRPPLRPRPRRPPRTRAAPGRPAPRTRSAPP
ncbi:hypothetical protein ACFSTC_49290 [Nonomuraea ferruginea]